MNSSKTTLPVGIPLMAISKKHLGLGITKASPSDYLKISNRENIKHLNSLPRQYGPMV